MKNLTIRNIPDELLKKIRIRAARARRSMNSEILNALEAGLNEKTQISASAVSVELRKALWQSLAGHWTGSTAEDLISLVYKERMTSQ